MKAAGYDLDRKRLIEIYAQAKAIRHKPSAAVKAEEAGQLRLPGTDEPPRQIPDVIKAGRGVVMTWNHERRCWLLSGHEGLTPQELDEALKPVEEILGPPCPAEW